MSTPAFRGVSDVQSQLGTVNDGGKEPGFIVPSRVSKEAGARPTAIAVSHNQDRLLYGEFESRANQLAWHLRSHAVGANSIVGVHLDRTLDMVIALFAIMKLGAAYMPLDPAYPDERLAFMTRDAKCRVVLSTGTGAEKFGVSAISVDLDRDSISKQSTQPPDVAIDPQQPAYVIYTSGSTGTPKGVAVQHGALANLVRWHIRQFGVTQSDRASHLAGLGFDAAVWELWPYLAAGASVHLTPGDFRTSPESLRDWMVEKSITIGFVPTPLAELMLRLTWPSQTALRIMLTGGDTLHTRPPSSLPFTLVNNYGPTECTVVATSGEVRPDTASSLPPIGSPIDNVEIHILDERLRPVPDGGRGELFIGGSGVALGYVNHLELTAERFVAIPLNGSTGARFYRTGDLGRRLPDGQIEFLGRVDEQIKIRGYRVEPNEIAAVLNSHPGVRASAVVAHRYDDADTRLVAYIVPDGGTRLTSNQLQQRLTQKLPDYMVPGIFVRIDSLPLTTNGKLDRTALPDPAAGNLLPSEAVESPQNVIEERVAGIVAALLQLEHVGRDENFFMLGGHSLMGTQLIAQLRSAFGIEVPLRTLFDKPTVVDLSEEVESLIMAKLDRAEAA